MCPLAMIQKSIQKRQALHDAQVMASKPFPVRRDPVVLVYRGVPYLSK